MSWVKREDTAVERVTGLRAQTLEFEQEKEEALHGGFQSL